MAQYNEMTSLSLHGIQTSALESPVERQYLLGHWASVRAAILASPPVLPELSVEDIANHLEDLSTATVEE